MSRSETNIHIRQQTSQGNQAREDLMPVENLLSGYMEEANKDGTLVSDFWKDDANGVLVFTGLLSATVAAFIVQSYPMLSSDSGDKTAYLLGQISQQLTVFSPNGTYIPPTPDPIYSPSLSIILVNCFWVLSLVLSIASAVAATLMQQWTRRYIQLPQIPSTPKDRARVRAFLFLGDLKYRVSITIEAAALLLHLSVFLFFTGLVLFLFTISKTVAIVVAISVGFFGIVYLILTILPIVDLSCPYHTPMSRIGWSFWHTLLFFIANYAHSFLIIAQLEVSLLMPNAIRNSDRVISMQRTISRCKPPLVESLKKHLNCLAYGIRGSIIRTATKAPMDLDPKALALLLNAPALADKNTIQEFVANVPGDMVIRLVGVSTQTGKIFSQHLSTLMRSCTPDQIELDEDTRRRRLHVCLSAIHPIARAYTSDEVSLPKTLLEDVRTIDNLANIDLMRSFWADNDPVIRVKSRSICALLARSILRNPPTRGPRLTWLQNVLGEPSITTPSSLGDVTTTNNMNLDSFVYGVLSDLTDRDDLPAEPATNFVETLAILMGAGSTGAICRSAFDEGLADLLQRSESDNRLGQVADKLRRICEAIFPSESSTSMSPE
ncbi:hypothetical protein EI94DRAFT_1782213 [Lactarius quietus]|nr:hypothetical protein EI94DRAFT_1782213 [Lactarius quietus]